jgi:hypothetical protein
MLAWRRSMSSTGKTPHCPRPAHNLSEAGVAAAVAAGDAGGAEAEAAEGAEAEAAGALEAVQGAEAVVSGGVAEAAVCRGALAASARLGRSHRTP